MKSMLIFMAIGIAGLFFCALMQKPIHRFVGTVESVSDWDGSARLKTKGARNQDTIIFVTARRRERFVAGQIITVWSGGDLISDVASTDPQ